MAKSFLDKLQTTTNARTIVDDTTKPKETITNVSAEPKKVTLSSNSTQKNKQPIERKKGRPCIDETKGKKRNYCKTINIAVPKDKIDLVNEYALNGRGLNLTEYINFLIEQDLERNLSKYKKEIARTIKFD